MGLKFVEESSHLICPYVNCWLASSLRSPKTMRRVDRLFCRRSGASKRGTGERKHCICFSGSGLFASFIWDYPFRRQGRWRRGRGRSRYLRMPVKL